ncbi:hypothetical protein L0222_21030 [bacterium]|nr:hypothetical protein [bacterium]MCI0603747.1 hypothetical protein [bacterium]
MNCIFCFICLFLVTVVGESWTSRTYQVVVVQSTKLMPASFQRIMRQHKEEILRGSLKPDEQEEDFHRYDLGSRSGFLIDRIQGLTKSIPQKIATHVPFREIAEDLGRLSHYACDLNDPLILLDSDSREPAYRVDFAIYLEKNIEKFPWIFDGHEHYLLAEGNVKEYVHQLALHVSTKYPRLGEAYFPRGTLVSSDTFDPRSLPFGIASLSYSHCITNTVQLWFHAWKEAHGDITYTPLYKRKRSSQ